MAKKSDLQAELAALGKQAGVDVILDQQNAELEEDIKELKAKLASPESPESDETESSEDDETELVTELIATITFETRSKSGERMKKLKGECFFCEDSLASILVKEGVASVVTG